MGKAMAGAPAAVRVLDACRVVPAPAPVMHADPVTVKLSFLDAPWIAAPPNQVVFLYKLAGGDDGEYPAAVRRLKASLATTLALYLPLAGKLVYVPDTGGVVVDCSDAGVPFVEAEAEGGGGGRMDVGFLASDEAHDVAAFLSLVPEHDARVLPAPAMALQATRLPGAGLALGVSVHHAVVDARAMALFFHSWVSASRSGGSPVASIKLLGRPPEYQRGAVARTHPSSDELARALLEKVAPHLPVANSKADYFSQRSRMARRTFFVGANDVQSLKQRIDKLALAAGEPAAKPKASTFVAVLAVGWTGIVRAKALSAGEDAYLTFYADLRARLRPPVGADYFGNCLAGCLARADAGDLRGEAGLLHASRAVSEAVRELEAAPLAGMEGWTERVARLPPARLTRVAGDPVYRLYEVADFGFGRPGRIEAVSMNHDGRIMLRGGRRRGEVQLSVALHPAHVDAFTAHVNGALIRPRI
ncbi:unnamed protein product [Urochloa humidicola]